MRWVEVASGKGGRLRELPVGEHEGRYARTCLQLVLAVPYPPLVLRLSEWADTYNGLLKIERLASCLPDVLQAQETVPKKMIQVMLTWTAQPRVGWARVLLVLGDLPNMQNVTEWKLFRLEEAFAETPTTPGIPTPGTPPTPRPPAATPGPGTSSPQPAGRSMLDWLLDRVVGRKTAWAILGVAALFTFGPPVLQIVANRRRATER